MTTLLEHHKNTSPLTLFDDWYSAAAQQEGRDHNAMTLATIDADGMPQARTVLLKDHADGEFAFYTNSESRKGQALQANPRAALLFFWRVARRQVLIEGDVRRLSSADSAPYFDTRPRGSRLGAWASQQSRPIESHAALQQRVADVTAEYDGREPPIPPYWRGYHLRAARIEFWQEGEFRLHQRLAFTRDAADNAGGWRATLLQP